MSIDNKLTYLQETKEGIKTAIQNKGVEVTDADTFRSYAEKIALIEGGGSGGETSLAYYSGQAVAGDKVMLTKVNSFVTPDDAFCNGFRPYIIMNGYAYGVVGEATSANFNTRRQIVDGVISNSDSVSITTYSSLSWKTDLVSFYLMNGTCTAETLLTNSASGSSLVVPFAGTKQFDFITSGTRVFVCETGIPLATSGYGRFFDYTVPAVISGLVPPLYYSSFCFEDSNHDFYWINANLAYIYKWNRATNTTEQIDSKPAIIQQTSANLLQNNQLFIQTKDFKYLLNGLAYVELDIENNTYTIKDYPAVIKNAMGDRTLYCMQVFYDGCFSIQLSDGTTLICKYTNSMEDVEIKEIVEPIYIDGDPTVYQRSFSPDRMYWFNRPLYTNKVVAVPLANNPAGPYKAKEAVSEYMAFTPSKDRFNSTVLTGFLTGETEPDAEGRQMAEVKTVSGI